MNKVVLVLGEKSENEFIERYGDSILFAVVFDHLNDGMVLNDHIQYKSVDNLLQIDKNTPIVIGGFSSFYAIRHQLNEMALFNCYSIPEYEAIFIYEQRRDKNIFLLLTPDYGNIGDQAIAYAEVELIRKIMPDYNLIEIDLGIFRRVRHYLKKLILDGDIIYITGGGFLGSLWVDGGEYLVREIIENFPNNEIVIFPQSLYFEHNLQGTLEKDKTISAYNRHNKLKMLMREHYSYRLAKAIFADSIMIYEIPDVVLSLNRIVEDYPFQKNKKLVAVGLKTDKESLLQESEKTKFKEDLSDNGYSVKEFSTQKRQRIIPKNRKCEVINKLCEIQGYDLVITDCLHGMIFCAIVGTPCIALDQISHKVRGEYKWISELPHIEFVEDIINIDNSMIEKMIKIHSQSRFNYTQHEELLKKILRDDLNNEVYD